ncbi:hypothetical protein EJ110_NYTH01360 [Nymphaea thermarum]|nr:hypothetical protein EJ110_NYTH01360 [Nymphaea thermarum]
MECCFDEEEMEACSALLELSCSAIFRWNSGLLPLRWGAKRRRHSPPLTQRPHLSPPIFLHDSDDGGRGGREGGGDEATPSSPAPTDQFEARRKPRRTRKQVPKKKTHKELKELVAELLAEQEELRLDILEATKLLKELKDRNLELKAKECLNLKERQHQPEEESDRCNQIPDINTEPPSMLPQQSPTDQLLHDDGPHIVDSEALEKPLFLFQSPLPSLEGRHLISIPATVLCQYLQSAEVNASTNCVEDDNGLCFSTLDVASRAAIAAQARKRRIEMNRMKSTQCFKIRTR